MAANSALIEDLRKQFAENPRRIFARLANEYRKSGDLDIAIEICRAHVPLQPTYISGYIVLGQALFERGQPEEARSTFETALALDPENLIALRQLGDIARASGDPESARGWYHKLLEVDPQNEDIAAQLGALEEQAAAAAPHEEGEHPTVSWSDIHPDSGSAATVTAPAQSALASTAPVRPRFTIGVIPENADAVASEPSAPSASTGTAPAASAEPAAETPAAFPKPVADDAMLPEYIAGYDRHAPAPPVIEPAVVAPEPESEPEPEPEPELANAESAPSESEQAERRPDIAAFAPDDPTATESELSPIITTAEHPVPGATAAEIASLFAGSELEVPMVSDDGETPDAPAAKEDDSAFAEEDYDPTIGRMLDLQANPSSNALLPELMMTESGAELLREQGHIDQAIYVYRHLATKHPNDSSYAERIAALERGAHSSIPLVAAISEDIISAAKKGREYSTQSIRSFFTSFATRRPPESREAAAPSVAVATTDKPPEAAPDATPAAETAAPAPASAPVSDDRSALESLFSSAAEISADDERAATALASAFSEEYSTESVGPAGQPTRAASDALSLDAVFRDSRARAEGEHRSSQPTVSFDEFFANRENGTAAAGQRGADLAVETTSAGDDSASDLELFHEWLDGLKK